MPFEKGTERQIVFIMADCSGNELAGLTVSSQVSKDGGAFDYTTNNPSEISDGFYKVTLTGTEMAADVVAFMASGKASSAVQQNLILYTESISSQISSIPVNIDTQLISTHGAGNWEGLGGSSWISSQLNWISSQTGYISSNLEAYGGGGGGGTKYVFGEGLYRKSPWTYRDKEKLIEETHNIFEIIKTIQKNVDDLKEDIDNKTNKLGININDNLKKLENVKVSLKDVKDKDLTELNIKIDNLITELNNIKDNSSSKENINDLSTKIEQLYGVALKSLSDDDLEKLTDEYEEQAT